MNQIRTRASILEYLVAGVFLFALTWFSGWCVSLMLSDVSETGSLETGFFTFEPPHIATVVILWIFNASLVAHNRRYGRDPSLFGAVSVIVFTYIAIATLLICFSWWLFL